MRLDWAEILFLTECKGETLGPYVPCIDENSNVAFWYSDESMRTQSVGIKTIMAGIEYFTPLLNANSHPVFSDNGLIACYCENLGLSITDPKKNSADIKLVKVAKIGPLGPTSYFNNGFLIRSSSQKHQKILVYESELKELFVTTSFSSTICGLPLCSLDKSVYFRLNEGNIHKLMRIDEQGVRVFFTSKGQLSSFPSLLKGKTPVLIENDHEGSTLLILANKEVQRIPLGKVKVHGALAIDSDKFILFSLNPMNQLEFKLFNGFKLKTLFTVGRLGIVDFALNQVSVNSNSEFVIRMAIDSGQKLIVKSDWEKSWFHSQDC